jgi:hypothetical protein
VLAWIFEWLAAAGLYLLFAGTLSVTEATAAAAGASLALAFHVAARRCSIFSFAGPVPWARLICRALGTVIRDIVSVAVRLAAAGLTGRPGEGETRQAFDPGDDSPQAERRRAVVTLAASIAPNGYVMGIETDPPMLLMHRLAPSAPSLDRTWPV